MIESNQIYCERSFSRRNKDAQFCIKQNTQFTCFVSSLVVSHTFDSINFLKSVTCANDFTVNANPTINASHMHEYHFNCEFLICCGESNINKKLLRYLLQLCDKIDNKKPEIFQVHSVPIKLQ